MTKDKNIKIKLELYKNDNGEMGLIVHFNEKSPNVVIENNEYFWMPTVEEKDLINESFELFPCSGKKISTPLLSHEKKEINSDLEEIQSEVEEEPELEPEPEKEEDPPKDIEEPEKPSVFEITKEPEKPSYIDDMPEEPPEDNQETPLENESKIEKVDEEKTTETEDKKKIEDAIIVEADSDAIEAALEKHQKKDEDDNSIIEADEKTIIDKVLKQKKKGKWSKK